MYQIIKASDQVSGGAQALSEGATEQADTVEKLAVSVGGISQQIRSNAENAQNASRQASEVGEEMELTNSRMQDMMKAMGVISYSSKEIEKIIKAIEDIAFQANILALNAAVEAARAGAAEKGFPWWLMK